MDNTDFQSFFKTVKAGEGDRCKYPTRLDTYGCGCAHNCSYCYARSLLAFRGLWNPEAPKEANLRKICKTIERDLLPGDIVRLGGMTDCFQPLEAKRRKTLKAIKVLEFYGIGYLIVTKSDLVASPEYMRNMDKRLAHIQISVTSTDDAISKRIEPGAALPEARIKAVETLQKEGFDVAVRLSPYIPEFVDVERIKRIECDKFQVEFLRVNSWIEKWLHGSGVNLAAYNYAEGGYKHLPLEVKKELLSRIQRPGVEISICEDVTEHYNYWTENFNPNKEDCCNLRK